ncbi:MAG: universal stress protein [Actinobacteria bacterium]|nr:MAG: universal stress protein [Actinomycetota bacterium]
MYKKVLIATDGSATAAHAAEIGIDVAKASGAEALILHVGDPKAGKKVLQQVEKSLAVSKVPLSTMSVSGDPADMICEVAEKEGVDLIVVGNKGMTGAKRFLLGSVPNQVSHHSPCNVLIVKTT